MGQGVREADGDGEERVACHGGSGVERAILPVSRAHPTDRIARATLSETPALALLA